MAALRALRYFGHSWCLESLEAGITCTLAADDTLLKTGCGGTESEATYSKAGAGASSETQPVYA